MKKLQLSILLTTNVIEKVEGGHILSPPPDLKGLIYQNTENCNDYALNVDKSSLSVDFSGKFSDSVVAAYCQNKCISAAASQGSHCPKIRLPTLALYK